MKIPTQRFVFPDGSEYRWVYDSEMDGWPERRWRWEDLCGAKPPTNVCRELRDIFVKERIPALIKILNKDEIKLLNHIKYRMEKAKGFKKNNFRN